MSYHIKKKEAETRRRKHERSEVNPMSYHIKKKEAETRRRKHERSEVNPMTVSPHITEE